ncbi:Pre-rRNA-processing protein [Yarrowia sp. C11]|nr:Pre-rRNA-processing protein [Yarrowia sp. C11]KAG5363951.1 Pre-rRNA-processing protein [Yarrowia sp. E02]
MARAKAVDFFSTKNDSSDSEEDDKPVVDPRFVLADSDSEGEQEEEEEEEKGRTSKKKSKDFFELAGKTEDDDDDEDEEAEEEELKKTEVKEKKSTKAKVKPMTKEEIEKHNKKIAKTGVVYFSRIPPLMDPGKLRMLLQRFGIVDRIYLVPEDPKAQAVRIRHGGNRALAYTEGWAEFTKKRYAKTCASTLNGNTIGGKKGSQHYDDIMNAKYLPKFKWSDLSEQLAQETHNRQARLRTEISQATRENQTYIQSLEKSKAAERRRQRQEEEGGEGEEEKPAKKVHRDFHQGKTHSARAKEGKKELDGSVGSILGSVM